MRHDISALLDGELEADATGRVIDALRRDPDLREAWELYQLVGDALRQMPAHAPGFSARVMACLSEEPVLFVPAARPRRSPLRFALPMAAAVAGMAVVGWLALSLDASRPLELAQQATLSGSGAVPTPANAVARARPANPNAQEYIVAHQAHSAGSFIQPGGAAYIRSVSDIGQSGRP